MGIKHEIIAEGGVRKFCDAVLDGAGLYNALLDSFPNRKKYSYQDNYKFAKKLLKTDACKKYIDEKNIEYAKIREKELTERKNLWSFDESVKSYKTIIAYAHKEIKKRNDLFDKGKIDTILTGTTTNAVLSATAALNRMFHLESIEDASDSKHKKQLESSVLELRLKKEKLMLERELIALDKEKGEICYNETAVWQFSQAIQSVHSAFRMLPQLIIREQSFTPDQREFIQDAVNKIIEMLSGVTVELSSTEEIDNRIKRMTSHESTSAKRSMIKA